MSYHLFSFLPKGRVHRSQSCHLRSTNAIFLPPSPLRLHRRSFPCKATLCNDGGWEVEGFDMVRLPVLPTDRKDAKPLCPTTPTCAALTLSFYPFASSCAAKLRVRRKHHLVQGFDIFHVRSFTPELGDASFGRAALLRKKMQRGMLEAVHFSGAKGRMALHERCRALRLH